MLGQLITFAYAASGFISIAAYAPQIWNLVIATGESRAISISSWSLWVATSGIGLIYMLSISANLVILSIYSAGFISNVLILGLTLYNRFYRFKNNPDVVNINFRKAAKKRK